jgi:transcriptional regulator with XRE-family HTH domain
MDDIGVGKTLRAIRIRRGLRQEDVAIPARVHRSTVSRIERGHVARLSLQALRSVAATLEVRVELVPRWRGGELDRLVNARHSALHETLAWMFRDLPEWIADPEVSFAIYGERGIIDVLAYHPGRRALLVIEIKSELVDVQDLIGKVDRYRRLARRIAAERDWNPLSVSVWVAVEDSRTNRRRVEHHRALLRSAFPEDGRTLRRWLHDPVGTIRALSYVSSAHPRHARPGTGGTQRVRRPPAATGRA